MSANDNISSLDSSSGVPVVDIPRDYNNAVDFIQRNIQAGRGDKIAVIDDDGSYSYADVAERINRTGNALKALGIEAEQRVLMCMLDSVDFIATFFGAMKIGAVAIPVNTLLTADDYDYMMGDSRAKALVVSTALWDKFEGKVGNQEKLSQIIQSGPGAGDDYGTYNLSDLQQSSESDLIAANTTADDAAFWLYSSGSTGRPKGVVHLHSHMAQTAALYGEGVLGVREDDIVFSAAKLFFAYGLGNGLTFPFYIGATAVLMAERPTPEAVMQRLQDHQATIFYGVPTLYGAILADDSIQKESGSEMLRACVSAGEALPVDIARRFSERFGVEILDGIGSTEMLHIFLSNQPGDIRYGTTGKAVPGYDLRVVDEDGNDLPAGEMGELLVNGPSAGAYYWNNREKSLNTFQGPWTRTGDKYILDDDGYYIYAGRSDDMLKVSGIWVSPFEVESALMEHGDVLEAAVVGQEDKDKLIKPKAYIVLNEGVSGGDGLVDDLKQFVKDRLAPYKYPRWIEFSNELPKTATGKIQRFKLR
jgi:4-hydroxybenzoate-CoA ligase/benzoate-CoA ligase